LFGSPKDSRLGWLTIGVEEFSNQEPARTSVVGYNKETFDAAFEQGQVPLVVPNTPGMLLPTSFFIFPYSIIH